MRGRPSLRLITGPVVTGLQLDSGWAWGTLILPYLEQKPVYDSANFSFGFGRPRPRGLLGLFANRTVMRTSISMFLCPSAEGGEGPLDLGHDSGTVAGSPGQYIASAGWIDSSQWPIREPASSTRTAGSRSVMLATEQARP